MDKKLLLALVLSLTTLILFHYFNRDNQQAPPSVPTDVRPGQSYKVPTVQDLARPISTEIDFIDKKVTQKEEIKTFQTDLYKIGLKFYLIFEQILELLLLKILHL